MSETFEKQLSRVMRELGKRGGAARAAALSPDRRREIAVTASKAAKAKRAALARVAADAE